MRRSPRAFAAAADVPPDLTPLLDRMHSHEFVGLISIDALVVIVGLWLLIRRRRIDYQGRRALAAPEGSAEHDQLDTLTRASLRLGGALVGCGVVIAIVGFLLARVVL